MPGSNPVSWGSITGKPSLVTTDVGANAVGQFAFATSGVAISTNQTLDGSNLTDGDTLSTPYSGTWRYVGAGNLGVGNKGTFQRVA